MACVGRALRASKLAACAGGAQGVRLLCGGIRSARTSHRAARGGAHFAPGIRLSHRGGWPLRGLGSRVLDLPRVGGGCGCDVCRSRWMGPADPIRPRGRRAHGGARRRAKGAGARCEEARVRAHRAAFDPRPRHRSAPALWRVGHRGARLSAQIGPHHERQSAVPALVGHHAPPDVARAPDARAQALELQRLGVVLPPLFVRAPGVLAGTGDRRGRCR